MTKQTRWLQSLIIAMVIAIGMVMPAAATTSKTDESLQGVAQSYTTVKTLQPGVIVQLNDKQKAVVEAVTAANAKKTFGVVVPANASPVTLSDGSANQQVYVATSGRYNTLVSTQNGPIKTGDYIGVSAIDGIGMKADGLLETVVGRAATNFDGKSNVVSSADLKTSDGKSIKTALGVVSVNIKVEPNPNRIQDENGVPTFIQNIARSIVGKPITPAQLYTSVAILVLGLGVVASLLYGGIQTGMIAIGRNPLAKKSITRNMVQVIATGFMIFIGCLVAVYLILKL